MDISQASTYDYIALNGHMRAIYKKKYNCDLEIQKLKTRMGKYEKRRPMIDEHVEKYKASRGCNRVVSRTVDRIDNIQFNTCLCSIKHPLMGQLLTLNSAYEKGILPFKGSLMDQPAQAIDLIELTARAQEREVNLLREEQANGRR